MVVGTDQAAVAHHYHISNYEASIDRGECQCGAIHFYSSNYGLPPDEKKKLDARVAELQAKYGSEGKGHMAALHIDEKDVNKLGPEARAAIAEVVPDPSQLSPPPAPKKPEGGGAGKGSVNKAIGSYYDQNRAQILSDVATLGLKAALQRRGIFGGTWRGLQDKWARQDAGTKAIKRTIHKLNKKPPVTIETPVRPPEQNTELTHGKRANLIILTRQEIDETKKQLVPLEAEVSRLKEYIDLLEKLISMAEARDK